MNDMRQPWTADDERIQTFVSCACAGDIGAMRAQVAAGFDLNGTDRFGDTILERVISDLEFCSETPKYEVVKELLRLGADPNAVRMHSSDELLYDWAVFVYRYEVWNVKLPEEAKAVDPADKDAWLLYLDSLAVKYGKPRPEYLRLLRARGALSISELRQGSKPGQARSKRLAPLWGTEPAEPPAKRVH